MSGFKDVPIPPRMQHLPLDPRGYPIPHVVMISKDGSANFIINDSKAVQRCAAEHLCHVCGGPLEAPLCFVGGPRSAFHSLGAFFDGPMHRECATYALQVCPYLALPSYGRNQRTSEKHVERAQAKDKKLRVVIDPNVMTPKPQLFVLVMASRCDALVQGSGKKVLIHYRPHKPYIGCEFWRDGKMLDHAEGRSLSAAVMREPLPQREGERVNIGRNT
jgi:hypothetical protein